MFANIFKKLYVFFIVMALILGFSKAPAFAQPDLQADWPDYLAGIWAEKSAEWNWSAPPSGTPVWDGTASAPSTVIEGTKTVYLIATPQELWWTRSNFTAKSGYNNAEIRLMNNLDLGGANGKVWTPYSNNFKGEFNGQGFTIYNMRVYRPTNDYNGFFSITDTTANVHDLHFMSPKVYGKKFTGALVGFDKGRVANVCVEKALVELPTDSTGEWGSAVIGYCDSYSVYDGIVAKDCILYGGSHLGAAICMASSIQNSYAIGCTIISTGYHSGGFMSCTDFLVNIKNCFSNCEVYGTKETGAFLGYTTNSGTGGAPVIENCFSLGSVEGLENIGGFCPVLKGSGSGITVRNCYSTAIVGMRNGGTSIGSFAGTATSQVDFQNCFAAGEVGGLYNNTIVGGFIGANNGATFQNCYYDKQTTAMHETAVGLGSSAGITGLLTNSVKGGDGLKMTGQILPGFDPAKWKFEAQLYPQLHIFADARSEVFSDNTMDCLLNRAVGAAYSAASVATPLLAPWENVPVDTAYDTVRDITLNFPLSQNSNHVISWTNEGSTGAVDPSKTVLILSNDGFTEIINTVGIEWIYAQHSATVSGVSATAVRPLRVIPTRSLEAGEDQTKNTGETYDNWTDVELIDSTALELSMHMRGLYTISPIVGRSVMPLVENGNAPGYTKNSPWITDQQQNIYDYFRVEAVQNTFNGNQAIPSDYGGKTFTIAYSWLLPDGRFLTDDKQLTIIADLNSTPIPVVPSDPDNPSPTPPDADPSPTPTDSDPPPTPTDADPPPTPTDSDSPQIPPDSGSPHIPPDSGSPHKPPDSNPPSEQPKTGDTSDSALVSGSILLLSLCGIYLLFSLKKSIRK